jgi:hypothetical protein
MKLDWDKIGERYYETGVKKGVLYPQTNGIYPTGVAWNGLTAVTESPSGAEASPIYADDIKYLNLMSAEEFGATVEAYMYPKEFAKCDGSESVATGVYIGQQTRQTFGLCYRTALGNDTDGVDHGYRLHLIYGALSAPSEKGYATQSADPEAITLSWEITTTPVEVTGKKPTASLTIDSTTTDATKLAALEAILYGTESTDPRLPLPNEVISIFTEAAPSALALSSIAPTDDATAVAVDANIILTFNNKVSRESVIVTSDSGVLVAGVRSWDATGKILTFNPTTNLSAATVYLVTVGGVVDVYGQALAPEVKNFTTA